MKFSAIILAAIFLVGCGLETTRPAKELRLTQLQEDRGLIIIEPSGAEPPGLPDYSGEFEQQPQAVDEKPLEEVTHELASFMESVREADPEQETILRVFMNEKKELAVVLHQKAERELIPLLARTLLMQMNKLRPGEQLTVVFYAPTSPLFEIGKAELDVYRGLMTYRSNQALM